MATVGIGGSGELVHDQRHDGGGSGVTEQGGGDGHGPAAAVGVIDQQDRAGGS